MNQDDLGTIAAPASADFLIAKRKRGRPRKDENLFHSDNSSGLGRVRRRRRKADSSYSDNAMVGQIVSGVLDGSFDSGYLLTVRVGDTSTVLRGVVFESGRAVPISAANDVAPHVKMFQRTEVAVPTNELRNLVPTSAHMLQPVFKNDRSARRLHKNDPLYSLEVSPSAVRKEILAKPQSPQTEAVKYSNELLQKRATPPAHKELQNDSCKVMHAMSQVFHAETKTTHGVDASKRNEPTLPEGQSNETGQAPLTTSESERGNNPMKEASDRNELSQPKGSHSDGIEAPAITPQTLLLKIKTEDVHDMPKETVIPLPAKLPCDANEESTVLQPEIKMEKSDSEPQNGSESQKNEDVTSQLDAAKASGLQGAKETILAMDQPDANEDKSDTKQPSVEIFPEYESAISINVPTVAVQDLFSEAKTTPIAETAECGDSALPNAESIGQTDVETLCEAPQDEQPMAATGQFAEMLKGERTVDVPVVKPILNPNQLGSDADASQGIQCNAVEKSIVVPEEPLLPDMKTTGQAVESRHLNEMDEVNSNQVSQGSDNPTDMPVEKSPLSHDGLLSGTAAVILEASKNGNFGSWEEVVAESCQSSEEVAKLSGTSVDSVTDHL